MNPLDLSFWSRLLGSLALESAVVVGLVLVLERFVKNVFWRRTAWHLAIVMLLALTVSELSGLGRGVAVWLLGARREPVVETRLAPAAISKAISVEIFPAVASVPVEPVVKVSRNWWPGIIWIAGTAIVLARVAFAQALLLALRLRCKTMGDFDLAQRALMIGRRLGIRRKIQFLEVSGLKGPVAFGGLWPAVGLPVGFVEKFDRSQQDAMLAHELAHIAGGDPLWYRMADFVSACLWWQPLVWWSRHRLQASSEVVADEGTALLENGPVKLAECLVVLGRELTATRKLAWIGIGGGGFRSNLGKRVERLVNLKGREHFYSRFAGSATLKTVLAISGVVVVLLLSGWGLVGGFSKGKTLKETLSRAWKGSAGASVVGAVIERPVDVLSGQSKHFSDAEIADLIQNGKALYGKGQLDQAKDVLKSALSADPTNRAAMYYLDLIKEAEYKKKSNPRSRLALIKEAHRSSNPNPKDENPIAQSLSSCQLSLRGSRRLIGWWRGQESNCRLRQQRML